MKDNEHNKPKMVEISELKELLKDFDLSNVAVVKKTDSVNIEMLSIEKLGNKIKHIRDEFNQETKSDLGKKRNLK